MLTPEQKLLIEKLADDLQKLIFTENTKFQVLASLIRNAPAANRDMSKLIALVAADDILASQKYLSQKEL